MNILEIIGRNEPLFTQDFGTHERELTDAVSAGRFLSTSRFASTGSDCSVKIWVI